MFFFVYDVVKSKYMPKKYLIIKQSNAIIVTFETDFKMTWR